MENIIFIGGIHGSGKGKICEDIVSRTNLIHLTASEVLKWNELSNQNEKQVENISYTQNRLIQNLNKIVDKDSKYLLDGHYCLLNKDGIPEKIPIDTFKDINPTKLLLVIAEPKSIKERLASRDNKSYDIRLIEEFQNLEIEFCKEISDYIDAPIHIIYNEKFNVNNLENFMK